MRLSAWQVSYMLIIDAVRKLYNAKSGSIYHRFLRTFRRLDRSSRRLRPVRLGFSLVSSFSDSPSIKHNIHPRLANNLLVSFLHNILPVAFATLKSTIIQSS